ATRGNVTVWIKGYEWVSAQKELKLTRAGGKGSKEGLPSQLVAKAVLHEVMARMSLNGDHLAQVSVEALANRTGADVRTTQRALHSLTASGYLVRVQAVDKGALQCSNWLPGPVIATGPPGVTVSPGALSESAKGPVTESPIREKIREKKDTRTRA